MIKEMSFGIIGGADGPTAIFITGRFPWEIILLAALCVGGIIWYYKQKK